MRYRVGAVLAALITLLLLIITPVYAGGWAVVTLDNLPGEIRAGQALELGFMVRQHGVTPIDSPYNSGSPIVPVLSATNLATGEKLRAEATKNGAKGHFSVSLTFPIQGEWQWEITPPPFEATQLGRIAVLPAATTTPNAEINRNVDYSPVLRWGGLGLVTLALIFALIYRLTATKPSAGRVSGLR